MDQRTLTLTPDEMRSLGYLVVDTIVDHFASLAGEPTGCKGQRPALEA